MRPVFLVVGVLVGTLALIGGLAALGGRGGEPITDVASACVQHRAGGMHIHPHLAIRIDGQDRTIPADVGITAGCMRPLHTHDDSGTLHLEFPGTQDVTLGQFFQVWKQPFSATQVGDRVVGENETLTVTVNGQETAEREGLVLHDRDQAVIEVKKK